MKLRLGEEPPTVAKKKKKDSAKLDDFVEIYFKEKELEVKDIEKIKKSYINHIKPFIRSGTPDPNNSPRAYLN